MRKRMLIATALMIVVLMLMNCIAPVLQVQAATAKTTMSFNVDLYRGLKSYFKEKGISATYNDGLHTIKMENSTITDIKELSLKEKGISDITGLDVFTNVEKLILSGNDLDEESNLSILNNFSKLNYLDISSNQISDITDIQELVERLIALDSNAINLTSQSAKIVVDVPLDAKEQKTTVSYTMPQILEMAGIVENGSIKNKGILKADWVSARYYEEQKGSDGAPSIITSSISNPVTENDNSFDIKVGEVVDGTFCQYQGLIKWVISIKDISNVSYNINPASENILKESTFTLYYVVHLDGYEGVIFEDNNFYRAVKEQLTKNQIINSDLISYKYGTNENGETYYDICSITGNTSSGTVYCTDGENEYMIQNFNINGYNSNCIISKRDDNGIYQRYEIQNYEVEYVDSMDNSGNVTRTVKIKIPHYNSDCRDLYQQAYDEPYVLVITDLDLVNKITSLILNDKRIEDLSGLEKFVGLESNLNVSYNYINTLKNIYLLELNKESTNDELQRLFNEKKSAMITSKNTVTTAYKNAESLLKSIKDEVDKIKKAADEANLLDSDDPDYSGKLTSYKKSISDSKDNIYKIVTGNIDENTHEDSLDTKLRKILDDERTGLATNLPKFYTRLAAMYNAYNKEYKLTSLLIPELNYQTEEEYIDLLKKMDSFEETKRLVQSEATRIATLESANALSELDKSLIIEGLGLRISENDTNPISTALNAHINDLIADEEPKEYWTPIIEKMLEVNIYSEAANYCLIERMNKDTSAETCYVTDYLSKKIKDFSYEEIDTEKLTAIYEMLTTGSTEYSYNEFLYDIFSDYISDFRTCSEGTAHFCEGKYYNVESLWYKSIPSSIVVQGETISYTDYDFSEVLNVVGTNNEDDYFFNQLMVLANKFTAVDEVSRYVVLPSLKRIDVRNNEIETLGEITIGVEKMSIGDDETTNDSENPGNSETTTQETISEIKANLTLLKNLKEFYAGHNFVTGDITCVDWNEMTSLKKLDLSYNFITDISPLQVLSNLRYLDVSDNLLEGAFNLRLKEMPKIKDVKLAGNKYTDISQILLDYEMEAEGNFTDYFLREDTLNLDLSRQEIEIDLSDAISHTEDASVYEVELPPIFAQLEFIDATRTAYGTTSSKGSITAKGGYAYVPIAREGSYEGTVKVIAANGYPEDVTTSFGIDTVCTIKYEVKNIKVNDVVIKGESTRIEAGSDRIFSAETVGENVPDTTVEWDLVREKTVTNEDGSTSKEPIQYAEGTKIELITDENDENFGKAKLTVDPNETATEVIIEATSNYDDGKKGILPIEVYRRTVTDITVESVSNLDGIVTGKSEIFTATVDGTDLNYADHDVIWAIEAYDSEGNVVIPKANTKIVNLYSELPEFTQTAVQERLETKAEDGTIEKDSFIQKDAQGNTVVDKEGHPIWILPNGLAKLTVDKDETAAKITVFAKSVLDTSEDYENAGKKELTINKKKMGTLSIDGPDAIRTGNTETYTVTVEGGEFLDEEDLAVEWKIVSPFYSRYYNENTKLQEIIAVEGEEVENVGGAKFTIAPEETIEEFVIEATSKFDGNVYADKVITVDKKELKAEDITITGDNTVIGGLTGEYTVNITGNNLDDEDKTVTWDIKGYKLVKDGDNTTEVETPVDSETRIDKIVAKEDEEVQNIGGAILKVGKHEKADIIKIIAKSDFNGVEKVYPVTINKREVTSVSVYEQGVKLVIDGKGRTSRFTEIVDGHNLLDDEDKEIIWSVEGNNCELTSIKQDGTLVVHEDETAKIITVRATSKFDESVSGTSDVEIIRKEAASVTINEQDRTVRKGRTYNYTAIVEGKEDNLEAADKTVKWSIKKFNSENQEIAADSYTKINENTGELTIGAGETAVKIEITAESRLTPGVTGTATAFVSYLDPDLPDPLGYEIDEDDNVVGVSPDTIVTDFKARFVTDSNYTVKLFRDGSEIPTDSKVATGDVVKIYKDGAELSSNVIVVRGDVNGDGTVSVADTKLVKAHRARIVTLTGIYYKAADVNSDKQITISDVKLILGHRGQLTGYRL